MKTQQHQDYAKLRVFGILWARYRLGLIVGCVIVIAACDGLYHRLVPSYATLPVVCRARAYQDTTIVNADGEPITLLDQGTETVLLGTTRDGEFYIVLENAVDGYIWTGAAVVAQSDCLQRLIPYNVALPQIAPDVLTPPSRNQR